MQSHGVVVEISKRPLAGRVSDACLCVGCGRGRMPRCHHACPTLLSHGLASPVATAIFPIGLRDTGSQPAILADIPRSSKLSVKINLLKISALGNMRGAWLKVQSVLMEKSDHTHQFPRPETQETRLGQHAKNVLVTQESFEKFSSSPRVASPQAVWTMTCRKEKCQPLRLKGNYGQKVRFTKVQRKRLRSESGRSETRTQAHSRPTTVRDMSVSGHLTSKNCLRRMKEPICPELVMASILQGDKEDM